MRRFSGEFRWIPALVASFALPAAALESDRLAVEQKPGESEFDAAFEYERACWRLGSVIQGATPVQTFEVAGTTFVRLRVEGASLALRCLETLEPGRRSADGAVTWFDGFRGAALLPNTAAPDVVPDRVPEAVFVDPKRAITAPTVPKHLLRDVAHGDAEALAKAAKLPVGTALALVQKLAVDRSPGALAALETLAGTHPHWRIRRAALAEVDATVSYAKVVQLARDDAAWEVRHAAVEQLGLAAAATLVNGGATQEAANDALAGRITDDTAWEVRRNALWQLSTPAVLSHKGPVEAAASRDPDGRVRAAALEVLAGAGLVDRMRARAALGDPSAAVRAVAAEALVSLATEEDVPALFRLLEDPVRGVRLSAAALLDRLDDPTAGTEVFRAYLVEAQELDADPNVLDAMTDFLARAPFPGLENLVQRRLKEPLAPSEARRLVRLLSTIAPDRALAALLPLADAPEPARRALAAEGLPDLHAGATKRLALLDDADAEVRAGAVLGLCRFTNANARNLAQKVDLPSSPLGQEAALAVARCGDPAPAVPRLKTRLFDTDAPAPESPPDVDPVALAGIALFLGSVVLIKLFGKPFSART